MSSPRLVLLPGWGFSTRSLDLLADHLHDQFQIISLALPDFSQPNWLEQMAVKIPANSWLCGWSLGGMLACQLTSQPSLGCQGLITLASNPCFVQQSGWTHAMAPDTFKHFAQSMNAQPESTKKQFCLLCSQGDPQHRTLARQLQGYMLEHTDSSGLDQLACMDNRQQISQLTLPQLHIFAQQDGLVPSAAAQALQQLNPAAQVQQHTGSHAFVITHAHSLAQSIQSFIGTTHA